MVIDHLINCKRYEHLHKGIAKAFAYLNNTDLNKIDIGKHVIYGDDVFALVQEYETTGAENEQMEAHRKYIDVQCIINGEEQVGHAFLKDQQLSKEYDDRDDFLLVPDTPDFFTMFKPGTFMIFFPTDLHMPCIKVDKSAHVKKVVIKVKI